MSQTTGIEMPFVSPKRSSARIVAQFLRFCAVGGLNTFVDVFAFNLLIWVFPTQDSGLLVIFNSLAYLIGAVNSFCWNKLWTFRHRSEASNDQFARFSLVTSLSFISNNPFLFLSTNLLLSLS